MTCQQLDDILELYAVGELSPESAMEAERHLAECAACRGQVEAARARLAALEGALAGCRVSEGFVARTMARVRAMAAPAREPREAPETLRSRLGRYAALAAAAVLFVLAGYGFLQRPPVAQLERGAVAVAGPNARAVSVGNRLGVGDLVAAPSSGTPCLALAGGRLRVALGPKAVVRITDPRSGAVAQLERGDLYCYASGDEGAPAIGLPLGRVTTSRGLVSMHVVPQSPASGGQSRFQGVVTIVAHDGGARVLVPGRPSGLALQSNQVLTLSSDPRVALAAPVSFDALRRFVEGEIHKAKARHGELDLQWQSIASGFPQGAFGPGGGLFPRAVEVQDALQRTQAIHAELGRRLELLDRYQSQGRRVYRLVVRPAPHGR